MFEAIIAGIGLVTSAIGIGMSANAADKSAQLQQESLNLQKQEQAQRKQAMELDAMRRRREVVRQGIAARSFALTTATAQGAQFGSALPGAYGGIEGRSGVNTLGINQNEEIGSNIFALKGKESDVSSQAAMYGAQAQIGSGLGSLGGALMTNASTLSKVGSSLNNLLPG